MIRLTIGKEKFFVATKWSDVKNADVLLEADSLFLEICACSNIPMRILTRLSENQLLAIGNLITFLNDEEEIRIFAFALNKKKKKIQMCGKFPFIERVEKYVSVELESYELLETAKTCANTKIKLYQVLINLSRVYYKDEKKIRNLLSYGMDILKQLSDFLEFYRPMFEKESDADETKAGIENLSGFGSWGTAFVLANKNILMMDPILARPAIDIYTALFYSFRESEYIKNLYDIKFPKKIKVGK